MDHLRRHVLQGISCLAGSLLLPRISFASQGCAAPVQTPYGPMQRCTAGVDSMRFQSAFQQQDEWCWAASISMIFSYYRHPVSQSRIVKETWGKVVDMPGQPADILSDLNRSWTDDNGNTFTSQGDSLSVNGFSAVTDLIRDNPLIIGANGHATVLTALTGDTNLQTGAWQIVQAVVRDPWPGNGGKRVLSPQEWANISFAARVRIS